MLKRNFNTVGFEIGFELVRIYYAEQEFIYRLKTENPVE